LMGFLQAVTEYPDKKVLQQKTGISKKTIYRHRKAILAAGLPLTMTDAMEELPPLRIDRKRMVRWKWTNMS